MNSWRTCRAVFNHVRGVLRLQRAGLCVDQAGTDGCHADAVLSVCERALFRIPHHEGFGEPVSKSGLVFSGIADLGEHFLHKLVLVVFRQFEDAVMHSNVGKVISGAGCDVQNGAAALHVFAKRHVNVFCPDR